MLNFPYFGHGLLKRYTIAFGALFSNINISRIDRTTGAENAFFRVPLTFASKDKMLVRLSQDPTIQKPSAIDLPIMSFEYNIVGYDKDRNLNRNLTIIGPMVTPSDVVTTLTPVAYDIAFQLYAYVKFEEDGQKIVEQILPFFHPDMTLTIDLVDDINISRDIPIILHGVNLEDKFEGVFIDRPVKIWTLSFTMKALLFGPKVNRPLIKFVNTQTWQQSNAAAAAEANTGPVFISNTYPGLDANGNPTTNTIIAINPLAVNIDDNWAVINLWTDEVEKRMGAAAFNKYANGTITLATTTLSANGSLLNGQLSQTLGAATLSATGTVV